LRANNWASKGSVDSRVNISISYLFVSRYRTTRRRMIWIYPQDFSRVEICGAFFAIEFKPLELLK
jgi:hypothetical protein